jgi:hypothetical protein
LDGGFAAPCGLVIVMPRAELTAAWCELELELDADMVEAANVDAEFGRLDECHTGVDLDTAFSGFGGGVDDGIRPVLLLRLLLEAASSTRVIGMSIDGNGFGFVEPRLLVIPSPSTFIRQGMHTHSYIHMDT